MITLNIEHTVFMGGRREMWRFAEGSGGELVFERAGVEVRIDLNQIDRALTETGRHFAGNVSAAEVERRTLDMRRRSALAALGTALGYMVEGWWRAGLASFGAALAPLCQAIANTHRPIELD